MKKTYLLIAILIISFLLCSCGKVDDFSQNGNASTDSALESSDYQIETLNGTATIISHQYDPETKEIIIPEAINGNSVTTLGVNAFYQHTGTESIVLPSSLERIEGSCFYRCYSLKSSFIPHNVKEINGNPYFRCSSLESITVDTQNQNFCDDNGVLFSKDKTTLIAYPEGKTDESYTVPKTVTKIEDDAFGYHTGIKELYILSNVIEFPDYNMFIYPQDIKLYVESGSAAEKYAKEFNLNFEIISES